MSFHQEYLIM